MSLLCVPGGRCESGEAEDRVLPRWTGLSHQQRPLTVKSDRGRAGLRRVTHALEGISLWNRKRSALMCWSQGFQKPHKRMITLLSKAPCFT